MAHQAHHRGGTNRDEDRAGAAAWRSGTQPPLIGVTTDVADPAAPGAPAKPRSQVSLKYAAAIANAHGLPVFIPPMIALVGEFVQRFDAFVFTGGDDPRTEAFGEPTHPKTTPLHPIRQAFELALLDELAKRPEKPVLGVCLGMQLMALHAGGALNQHMPDDVPTADRHYKDAVHRIAPSEALRADAAPSCRCAIPLGDVTSHHRQAVKNAGTMRVIATADDGIIEAIDDPARRFYVGVQWHPERTDSRELGLDIYSQLVRACRI